MSYILTTAQATDLRDELEGLRGQMATMGYQEDANHLLDLVDRLDPLITSATRRNDDVVLEDELAEELCLHADLDLA